MFPADDSGKNRETDAVASWCVSSEPRTGAEQVQEVAQRDARLVVGGPSMRLCRINNVTA